MKKREGGISKIAISAGGKTVEMTSEELSQAAERVARSSEDLSLWITKVKVTEDRVRIEYTRGPAAGNGDEYMISSKERAAPGLYDTMKSLVPEVLDICELAEDYGKGLAVQGVTLSYGEETKATVTALKTLAHSTAPLVLNTPHEVFPAYEKLSRLIRCAKDYVRGIREQIAMEEAA